MTQQEPNNNNISEFLNEWAPRKEIVAEYQTTQWKSCLLVVSSTSGFGKASRLTPTVVQELSQYYQRIIVIPTTHDGHVREIFGNEPKLSTYDVAVILGGDGAFAHALNGMMSRIDKERVPLAHCPGGSVSAISGNTLGIWNCGEDNTEQLERVCQLIGTRKLSKMDVNRIQCCDDTIRYSALVLSGGNNADIVRISDDFRWTYAWFGPFFRYLLGFFLALFRYGSRDNHRRLNVTIQYDNDSQECMAELPVFGFSLYNCGRTTPDAAFNFTKLDSGSLGFVAVKHYLGFFKHLKFMKAVKKGDSSHENLFSRNNIRSIRVEPSSKTTEASDSIRPCYLGFDGEMINGSDGNRLTVPFTATVLPKEIEIVVA